MLSSWSKSFYRSACRESFPCCCWSASSKTNFHLRPTARVYELNWNWHTLKIFLPALNWASDLKLSILSVKMRRIAVLVQVVVVILFRRHASDKFQGAISWTITWIFLLNCLSLKYVLSDHFRWSNVPVHQNKLKMCLHFDQIRTWHWCLKLTFFGFSCTSICSLWKLFHPIKQRLK